MLSVTFSSTFLPLWSSVSCAVTLHPRACASVITTCKSNLARCFVSALYHLEVRRSLLIAEWNLRTSTSLRKTGPGSGDTHSSVSSSAAVTVTGELKCHESELQLSLNSLPFGTRSFRGPLTHYSTGPTLLSSRRGFLRA